MTAPLLQCCDLLSLSVVATHSNGRLCQRCQRVTGTPIFPVKFGERFTVKGGEVLNSLGVDSQGDVVVIWRFCCTRRSKKAQQYDLIGPRYSSELTKLDLYSRLCGGARKLLNILWVPAP